MVATSNGVVVRLACAVGLMAWAAAAISQSDSPRSLLERASEARSSYSFVGEFIYQYGGDIESMRIWRAANPETGIRERLESLSGESREILRDNETVTCILPSSESVMVDERRLQRPLDARLPGNPDALQPNYQLEVAGQGRVAGRPTTRLNIDARDDLRYGYKLWFDDETGLLLRAEVVSPLGEVLERVMVLSFELREQIDTDQLASQLPQAGYARMTTNSQAPDDAQSSAGQGLDQWSLNALPEGYALTMNQMQPLPGRDKPVRHLMISDGLASVSLYIESQDQADPIDGSRQMGALNAYGRALDGYQAIAVGEVPAATVERVANALTTN
ncbi:MucB/RseB C-terminal domain-containing protein [Spiribacter salinus]|uniref:MucB/RseB C-terminal domain-containing protein n=1 Tax=Spiribacter salinus TaxID=1335746 RepID=UPI001C988852|nr:MucB/RseB C-terminal domain-containing protein [Spiribacter salinus]